MSRITFQKWHQAVLRICLIVFAGELGFCLICFPWFSNWSMSYVPVHNKGLVDFWMSPYFRGGLTSLGLLNVYVAISEIGRLFKGRFGKV